MSTNRLSSSLSRRPSASVSDHLQKPSCPNANVAKWCREWYGDSDLAHHRCHGRAQSLEKLPRKGIVLRQYVDTPSRLELFLDQERGALQPREVLSGDYDPPP